MVPGRGGQVRLIDPETAVAVVSADGPVATMYVCGITPYDATHLGHAATYIAFDLLHRAWLDAGLQVHYASNVTDIDDPLLVRAAAIGVDWEQLATEQTALFAEDMTALGVLAPHTYLGAVETIPLVAEAVARLLGMGLAYRLPVEQGAGGADPSLGDVYADISTDPHFGAVAGLSHDETVALFAERGGDPGRLGKRDPLDPALWRRERPGEPSWDGGVLGRGLRDRRVRRPGGWARRAAPRAGPAARRWPSVTGDGRRSAAQPPRPTGPACRGGSPRAGARRRSRSGPRTCWRPGRERPAGQGRQTWPSPGSAGCAGRRRAGRRGSRRWSRPGARRCPAPRSRTGATAWTVRCHGRARRPHRSRGGSPR